MGPYSMLLLHKIDHERKLVDIHWLKRQLLNLTFNDPRDPYAS